MHLKPQSRSGNVLLKEEYCHGRVDVSHPKQGWKENHRLEKKSKIVYLRKDTIRRNGGEEAKS